MAERIISADSHMLVRDERVLAHLEERHHESYRSVMAPTWRPSPVMAKADGADDAELRLAAAPGAPGAAGAPASGRRWITTNAASAPRHRTRATKKFSRRPRTWFE